MTLLASQAGVAVVSEVNGVTSAVPVQAPTVFQEEKPGGSRAVSQVEISIAEGVDVEKVVLVAPSAEIAQRGLHIAVYVILLDGLQADAVDGDEASLACRTVHCVSPDSAPVDLNLIAGLVEDKTILASTGAARAGVTGSDPQAAPVYEGVAAVASITNFIVACCALTVLGPEWLAVSGHRQRTLWAVTN